MTATYSMKFHLSLCTENNFIILNQIFQILKIEKNNRSKFDCYFSDILLGWFLKEKSLIKNKIRWKIVELCLPIIYKRERQFIELQLFFNLVNSSILKKKYLNQFQNLLKQLKEK